MKNKIKQFARGDFHIERPDIRFSETHIIFSVSEGEVYQGSFTIENQKDGDIRGLIYSSSFRVHFMGQGFEGNPVRVNFTYDSTGLSPGQIENGQITVVCNGGEYELAFTAMIEKPFIMTAYGKIQNMADFKRLAVKDFSEARRLFRTRQFYDVLKYESSRVRNLYDHMRRWSLDEQALEEFLVGTKQKEKIFLTLSDESVEWEDILETRKDWIEITKNTWGYLPIHIYSDGDFIVPDQSEITTEDFLGSTYRLGYVVKSELLHAGNNYGRIIVKTPYETLNIEIKVHQYVKKNPAFGMQGMIAGQGLKEYLACISGKMDLNVWVEKALGRIKELRSMEPDNEYYILLQAHVCLRGRRNEEARWLLESNNMGKFVIGRKLEISTYYMFLNAILRKEVSYTNRVIEELNRLYIKYPHSWQILCMLINLDTKYRNYGDRIKMLENQYYSGANQILFLAESYICFQEKVLLLRKLDAFEIQVLNFATKYKIITKELALYAADLISQQKIYNKKLVQILERVYKMYDDPRILTALCMQLIKGNKIGNDYFRWYEKAVQQELKIAQLYEYYMMSINAQRVKGSFPRMIYLYFMHGINLDYKRTALLYANILTYEDEGSDVYKHYQEEIRRFAWEQLQKRHINDALRIIYTRFLRESEMSPEDMEALYDICHAYYVKTSRTDIKYVLVIEKDGRIVQRTAYTEEGARIYLYDKDARIVWEAKNGVHYTDSVSYDIRRLFYERKFVSMCEKCRKSQEISERDEVTLPVTFDNLKIYGMDAFDEQETFLLCTRRIREREYEEDEFLVYLSFELLKRGQYDKALLTYLARFYCGATCDMKLVWRTAREYNIQTYDLAERIITQMLFSEEMFCEEEIFENYYEGKPYFRLKQAFLAYVSRMYIVADRGIGKNVIQIILKEYAEREYLADICKAAVLKYYSAEEYPLEQEEVLHSFLCELCEKQIVFGFYLTYPQAWLQEVLLYDKVIVEYKGDEESRVRICYQINRNETEGVDYQSEVLQPVYENIYIKEFVLYEGEQLQYYFKETKDEKEYVTAKMICKQTVKNSYKGKYGRLNYIESLPEEEKEQAMLEYQLEENLAERLFLMC